MEPKFEDGNILMHPRNLPFDLITQNILVRLPIKPLIRFKSVSKQWYSTISSPQFAHTHLKSQHTSSPFLESVLFRADNQFGFLSIENGEMSLVNIDVDFDLGFETLVLVGSCNGLVCLGSTSGCLFIIWNPVTREFKKYTDLQIVDFTPAEFMVTWGFGYVSDVDDYKVVRVCKKESVPSFAVHVFSIRLNKWRRIDNNTDHTTHNFYGLKIAESLHAPGVLVNETLFWMGGVPTRFAGLERKIISFDLALELFDTFLHHDVSTPSEYATADNYGECFDLFLCVIKGCLSKYGRLVGTGEGLITILNHIIGEIEEIRLPRYLIGSTCQNLIELRKNDVIFTQYYGGYYGGFPECLGIISKTSLPTMHTPLIAFQKVAKLEIIGYSSSLISPVAVKRML